mmetsp:Transcript_25430/g.40664  ORF Transcript_25430/g.40664 Transcript_25430/m.40664 type:complete len:389 (-) Transcript_25430:289-1455(-)
MRSSWLYLARRSERQGAPVLIWPVARPTARSAMYESSVSPDRWDVITPHPAFFAMRTASIASEMVPIWFTLSSRALHALPSMAVATRSGLVTSRSSPTTWHTPAAVSVAVFSKSSWSKGSSIDTIGYSAQNSLYMAIISSPVFFMDPSLPSVLKSRSYILSSVKNSAAATSMPIFTLPVYPAFSIASLSSSSPSLFSWMLGANPPSSPTLHASCPYFFLMTDLRWWYTSDPMRIASENEDAPMGKIMNSCIASLFPACDPPLMTLNAGTGSTSLALPASSEMCLYRGTSFSAAPALETAMETARMALAPSLPLFLVPSSSSMRSSIVFCSVGSLPISAGAMMVLMFSTALSTPLPIHLSLSPSRSSTASWMPVEAPDGVMARNMPLWV